MAEISAKMVAQLREATGLGMMECKKALVETEGDIQKAEELLRIKSGAKASKVAGRTAAEGTVAQFITADGKIGALVEVNCETDFVAKDDGFLSFVKAAAQLVAEANPADVEALGAVKTADGATLEEVRKALIAKVGENIGVRRFVRYETAGKLATYLHGAKIGVLVDLTGGDDTIGKDASHGYKHADNTEHDGPDATWDSDATIPETGGAEPCDGARGWKPDGWVQNRQSPPASVN